MENLLQQIVDTGSSIAILDISGFQLLIHLLHSTLLKRLMQHVWWELNVISGIRPEIAQTVVHLAIDLTGIITKASLASALKTALDILSLLLWKEK